MGILQKAAGILGINARNHLYISRYNSQRSKRFADDKLYTKHFLESRDIGVAKTFLVVNNYEDLRHMQPDDLPESFVIKPNHGFGGQGILVIKAKQEGIFTNVSGHKVSFAEIFLHCIAILDGKFSISGLSDRVLIEERLVPHDAFSEVTAIGLPDVRIIVFNLVPIIAMLRVPTSTSEGKANIHLGGIGAGVDIGSGKTTYAVQGNEQVTKFPTGRNIRGFQIPLWEKLLLSAAKIQAATKIGFLAIDFVITKKDIKVLEVNARAGLTVQIANRVQLKARLEKVRDLKIPTPERSVEVAKTLFSQDMLTERKKPEKPIIGLFETVTLIGKKNISVVAKIDPHGTENFVSKTLFSPRDLIADILISERRLRLPFATQNFRKEKFQMTLAGKYLQDFLIDTARALSRRSRTTPPDQQEKMLKNIDRKICQIDKQIKLLSHFRPQNLEEQKEIFFKNPKRSPHFLYRIPEIDIQKLEKDLEKIPRNCDHPLMPLFLKKIEETERKIALVKGINTPLLQEVSEKLWGKVGEPLYKRAVIFLKKTKIEADISKNLPFSEVLSRIEDFLHQHKLRHWQLKVLDSTVADFQISKNNIFLIKKNARITENRLLSLLAHEVETHIYRFENARKAPYEIFQRGTAGYLQTEEGLASYNQIQVGVPLGEKILWAAQRVIAAFLGKKMSFVDLFHYLRNTYDLSEEAAWKNCLKVKRGLKDTEQRIAFTKDAIYFSGKEKVEKFLKKHPQGAQELYLGKIAITDLEFLKNTQTPLWNTSFLPTITVEAMEAEKIRSQDKKHRNSGVFKAPDS